MAHQRRQINSIPKDKVPNLNNLPHSFKKEKFKCVQKGTDVSNKNDSKLELAKYLKLIHKYCVELIDVILSKKKCIDTNCTLILLMQQKKYVKKRNFKNR